MKLLKKMIKILQSKIGKISRTCIVGILTFAVLFSIAKTSYSVLSSTHINFMTLTLNYEGAKKGLNPTGSRFNIAEIKSDAVLKRALDILGDDNLSVDGVKPRVTIDAKMPRSAIEQVTNAIASGSTYSYSPSEFDIYYSQKNKFGKNFTTDFLAALSEAYTEYFTDTYTEKNTILRFTEQDDFSQYDYEEIHQILSDRVACMLSYLDKHQKESNTFRSQNTGYTFGNLGTMLNNLRDIDLAKLEAYIIQNRISKDRPSFIRKQQYRVDDGMLRYDKSQQASDIINSTLNVYDAQITGVAFIPSVDKDSQYYMSRTKTGLDNLVNRSYSIGITATNLKKNIDEQSYIVEKYSAADDTTEAVMADTDRMIADICTFLDRISKLSIQTDNDYISSKTNNYITFRLPDASSGIPIIPALANLLMGLVLAVAAMTLYYLASRIIIKKKQELEVRLNIDSEE